ncbi:MAG TPA: Ig-like domain-containing protein [Longimicrobiales bacterium]|nr:Ig-like domain-containing protein [Longimicrobiales bacterium]
MRINALAVCLLAIIAAGCARPYPPPGGERDTLPPRLVGTTPEPLAVVPGFRGAVVFQFDERLSERNFSEALVTVSPLDSTLRVRRGRSEIRVEIDGGWRPDRVYRIVVLPGVRDMFGNAREEPAEVVFSTGPPVPATAVAGMVLDRLTGRPAQSPVVRAVRRGDEVSYIAVGDTAGFFSLRHLPMGVYDVAAFADLNRNRRHDAAEPVDGRQVSLGSDADTVAVVFNVLAVDSTAPRVTRGEVVDSLHVRLIFDDHFDPAQSMAAASAEVHALADSSSYATATRIVPGTVFERERRAAPAAPPDTAAADTVTPPPPRQSQQPQQPPLPTRELVLELDRPLRPGRYSVTVRNVVNISGLAGEGVVVIEVQGPGDG